MARIKATENIEEGNITRVIGLIVQGRQGKYYALNQLPYII
jgi:hypothetical protein